jgi:tRNA(adenine34) deaminase
MTLTTDKFYMQQALDLANVASCHNEVPVGAVIVKNGEVIAKGFNLCIQNSDPTAHAEIVAIKQAALVLQNYRLEDCELYVTLEPCCMCAGAILNSRIKRVVYAASDLKAGAAGSVMNVFQNPSLNHQTTISKGVLNEESVSILQNFFQNKRQEQTQNSLPNKLREDFLRLPTPIYKEFLVKNQLASFSYFNYQLNNLNGARLHYLDSGISPLKPDQHNQKTIVILPGLMQSTQSFLDIFYYFKNLGTRVVVIDLIGMGYSDKPKKLKHDSFEAMIDYHFQYLNELLQLLNISSFDIVATHLTAVIAYSIQAVYKPSEIYLQNNNSALMLSKIKSWNHFKKIVEKSDDYSSISLLPYPDKGHFVYTQHLLDLFLQSESLFLSHNMNVNYSDNLFSKLNENNSNNDGASAKLKTCRHDMNSNGL